LISDLEAGNIRKQLWLRIPKGITVLGPSLFLFYINDMLCGLKSTVRLFADDTIAVTSEADAVYLQSDLNKLGIWEKKWKIEFHPDKCNVLTISKKANPIKFEYKLHGQTLKSVNNAKYLGCLITSDLCWTNHINSIFGKANKTLGFLHRNLNIGSTTTKQNAYNSLVRPTVEYASKVWDLYTQKDIHTLEMVQCRGTRYVCNKHGNRSSVDTMLDTLKWKTLQRRRLNMLYKIQNKEVAISTEKRLIPPSRFTRNMHNLSFQIPNSNSDYRKFSFFLHTIRDWNSLQPDIVSTGSHTTFKAKVAAMKD
jgi:hypothetical protein